MNSIKKYCIVIPTHKESMNNYENISFRRCIDVFKDADKYLLVPEKLNVSKYHEMEPNIQIIRFPNKYFESEKGYNLLCKLKYFYKPFLSYQYMLLYQLDCFVFENNILEWIEKDYDYIGAPWLDIEFVYRRTNKLLHPFIKPFFRKVGNGGLSLRKIKKFYDISVSTHFIAKHFTFHEDLWWSNVIPRLYKLKIPDVNESLSFAFEVDLKYSLDKNGGRLPFGCHSWEKFDINFWRPIFKEYGYTI